jgi:hypothetical protein
MTMKKLLFLSILVLLASCQKNEPEDLFGKTPAERFEQSKNELRAALTASEQGWKFSYFTNSEKFGGYTLLMKFSQDGRVEMTSDIGEEFGSTQSQYSIEEAQGTLLVFSTYNHIHKLGDPQNPRDLLGKGLEGEFQFIYYGKEGNKLKFKTQRKDTEQFVYFEPATAQEWSAMQNLWGSIEALESEPIRHYFKVTANGNVENYSLSLTHRRLTLTSTSNSGKVLETGILPTNEGLKFNPPLEIEGKTFTELPWDNNASPARYIATVESVTAEIRFTRNPTPDQLSNDYAEINNISQLVMLNSYVKGSSQTSELFYNTVFKIDDTKSFSRIDIIFQRGICAIFVEYNFGGTSASLYSVSTFSLRDKRLFIDTPFRDLSSSNMALWQKPENSAIYTKAQQAIYAILALSRNGLYVKNLNSKYGNVYDTYLFQSYNLPIKFSAIAVPNNQ